MSFVSSVSSVAASSDRPDATLDRMLRRLVLTVSVWSVLAMRRLSWTSWKEGVRDAAGVGHRAVTSKGTRARTSALDAPTRSS